MEEDLKDKLIDDDMLILLKEQFGKVFKSEFSIGSFAWRILGRKEYKEITEDDKLTIFAREEAICTKCVLAPEGFDFTNGAAGVATVLSEQIMDASGFLALSRPQEI